MINRWKDPWFKSIGEETFCVITFSVFIFIVFAVLFAAPFYKHH